MKIFTLSLAAFVFFTGIAFTQAVKEGSSVGRYSIIFSGDGLYFLDTASGALWSKTSQRDWHRVDSPVSRVPEIAETSDKAVSLIVPEAGISMPMTQRERRKIPGSNDTIFVQLGDITGGQVFLEVIDVNGHHLVERTSLKNNQFLVFQVNKADVYVQVTDMVNNLLGEDICKIYVSSTKPKNEADGKEANDETGK